MKRLDLGVHIAAPIASQYYRVSLVADYTASRWRELKKCFSMQNQLIVWNDAHLKDPLDLPELVCWLSRMTLIGRTWIWVRK
jgi:hypothetical protein